MPEDTANARGILASARRLSDSLLGLLQSRVELFALEFQEEKLRIGQWLLWLTVAMTLIATSLLMAIGTLALFLWQTIGYAGLIGLTIILVGAATLVVTAIRRRILHGPLPFSSTVAEFQKDLECLHRDN